MKNCTNQPTTNLLLNMHDAASEVVKKNSRQFGTDGHGKDDATIHTFGSSDADLHSFDGSSSLGTYESSSLVPSKHRLSSKFRINARASEINEQLLRQADEVKKNKNIEEITINKLNFESFGLVGREQEIATLKSCFTRMTEGTDGNGKKELIFIRGYSGIGKSTLAKTLEKSVTDTKNGILVEGKFDLNKSDDPYSGIAAAFGEICRRVQIYMPREMKRNWKRTTILPILDLYSRLNWDQGLNLW
jgi:hypothetical protein